MLRAIAEQAIRAGCVYARDAACAQAFTQHAPYLFHGAAGARATWTLKLSHPLAGYQLWLGGTFTRGFDVTVDGRRIGTISNALSHAVASPSLGARQSPRGDSEPPEPTFGALGIAVRLYWLSLKNRYRKVRKCFLMSAMS